MLESRQPALDGVTWTLPHRGHAVVLGPNGAGKTTLLRLVAGHRFATTGTVDVLGETVGRVDMRVLRRRIGIVSDAMGRLIERHSHVRALVASALDGRTVPPVTGLPADSLERAEAALCRVGISALGDRRGTEVSEGEWKRALLARALVVDPDLLLLDEPCNGLDLAGREQFLQRLDDTLRSADGPAAIVVTHHLEEIPTAVTDALLLVDGQVGAAGPVESTVTGPAVSAAFGVDVEIVRTGGRFAATGRR